VFDGKKILITGGTGSLGQALARRLLKLNVDTVRIFSRNENNQVRMESDLKDDRLRFFVGDVRDYNRLVRALEDVDIVFHAAALKHVPVIEYNPFEAIKTNVIGTQNVIEACLHEDVEIAVGVGTDKAVSPLNTYGATKLLMEKLFVTADNYLDYERHRTRFIALRYGNVLGSSGSVLLKFINQIKNKEKLTITDPKMTRFSITMDEALDFILESTVIGNGAEIFVPKLRAYSILDLKNVLQELLDKTGEESIGIRIGEKLHETLINTDEMRYTYEVDNKYVILNPFAKRRDDATYENIKKVESDHSYSSDRVEKISNAELKKHIIESGLL
jgi:UDP-N-acetylglucosamine 4,6-dehydratase/UDP-glucose 4-epimerase